MSLEIVSLMIKIEATFYIPYLMLPSMCLDSKKTFDYYLTRVHFVGQIFSRNTEKTQLNHTKNSHLMQLNAVLSAFADMFKTLVVLFKEVIEHVLRIVHVMRQPLDHILHVGMGVAGKKTAARFIAIIAETDIFEISSDSLVPRTSK